MFGSKPPQFATFSGRFSLNRTEELETCGETTDCSAVVFRLERLQTNPGRLKPRTTSGKAPEEAPENPFYGDDVELGKNPVRRGIMKCISKKVTFARISLLVVATVAILCSVPVALPARSAEKPKILYALVDTSFDAPASPGAPFDPPLLIAANLEARKDLASASGDGEFRLGVIGSTRAASVIALAICPAQDENRQKAVAYTVVNTFSSHNQLAKLDLRTGAATPVGSPIVPELDTMAFACSPDGTLYAIGQLNVKNADFNRLYRLDRETGLATRIGSTGVLDPSDEFGTNGFFMALSFARDGTLYGVSDGAVGKGSPLYTIDRHTGLATKVANINVDAVMGLAIDEDGKFYVTDFVPQSPILKTHLDFVINIAFK